MTRRGVTLLEVAVAGAVLAAMTVICLQMLTASAGGRRALGQRQTALREATNVMERLAARPFGDLTPRQVAGLKLSEAALKQLPGGTLEIDVLRPDGDPEAKRVTVRVKWPDASGEPAASVQLVGWRYP